MGVFGEGDLHHQWVKAQEYQKDPTACQQFLCDSGSKHRRLGLMAHVVFLL